MNIFTKLFSKKQKITKARQINIKDVIDMDYDTEGKAKIVQLERRINKARGELAARGIEVNIC